MALQAFADRQTPAAYIFAGILATVAAVSYYSFADWPLATHIDEPKKIRFILGQQPDFYHPILMIQLARLANSILGHTEISQAVGMARGLSVAFGGILVFVTFVLGQLFLSRSAALAVAVAVAACPLVAVHATFFKEDIFLAPGLIISLAGLIWLIERPNLKRSLLLGLAIGVTISAKYVGAILLPFAIVTIMICAPGPARERLQSSAVISLVAVTVFGLVNAPLFLDLPGFREGLNFEINHATVGHDVALPLSLTFGTLHLTESLVPGLGLPLLLIGLAGLAAPFINREKRRPLAIILAMALLWYSIHEISPLKPFPDFERYMVPLAPLILILGASTMQTILARLFAPRAEFITPAIIILATIPALLHLLQIVGSAQTDPRATIRRIALELGPGTRFDLFSTLPLSSATTEALKPGGGRASRNILVTANFAFDHFLNYGRRGEQTDFVRRALAFYDSAFANPYLEISSGGPSYAFLNPVVRIVAMDGDYGHLQTIGEAIIEDEPRLRIAVGP